MFAFRSVVGLATAAIIATSFTGCTRSTQVSTGPETAVSLGKAWGNTLATRDAHRITNQYANDAILLATFTDKITNNEDRLKYFQGLAKNRNLRVQYNTMVPNALSNDSVSLSGLYTFMYEDRRGRTVRAPARYTFVWEKRDGEWKIVKHHSSQRPEKK